MIDLFMLEYMTVLGMTMVLLFLDSRYALRPTILTVYSVTGLLMVFLALLYHFAGVDAAVRSYSFVVLLPSFLLFFFLSRIRGWRLIFQVLTAVLFCLMVQHIAGFAYFFSGKLWVLVTAYFLSTAAVLWFLLRFLRPLFLQILWELQKGWWLPCLVIATYYGILLYLIPGYAGIDYMSTVLKPAISLLMVGFYSVLVFLFSSIQQEAQTRHAAQLFSLQLSALQNRIEAVQAAEHTIRTQRHDLRHRLLTAAELVSRGKKEIALDFLNTALGQLDEIKETSWCRPPILNAVFSSYFKKAQLENIQLDVKISMPDTLPAEEGELAVVLANALENALHANLTLPPEKRWIRCRMVSSPSLMLEVSNPCKENVSFDSKGLPIARREGHGLGVQSISAFCEKYSAVCQFELIQGRFRMRLVL